MNAATSALSRDAALPRPGGALAAALGCTLLTSAAGIACGGWLLAFGADAGLPAALICGAPAVVTGALSLTSQTDRQPYLARLLAAAVMLPVLLMMWALTEDVTVAQWVVTASVLCFIALHALGSAALAWHLAPSMARLEAGAATPVPADRLGRRLQSLLADSPHWRLTRGPGRHEWVLDNAPRGNDLNNDDGSQCPRLVLDIDPLRCEVQVRESSGASAAAPNTTEQASLRTPAGDACPKARPNPQRVWTRKLQTTLIEPVDVAAVRLVIAGCHAQAVGGTAAAVNDLLTQLAALITRSGYAWQPVLTRRAD